MVKLSVVISAYNEEERIEECLESVAFADEVILVDNESLDQTVEAASRFENVKIFSKPNNPEMFNLNKNWGFKRAKNEWILSLDADERVTSELKSEILAGLKAAAKSEVDGYLIPRRNIIFGKEMRGGIWYPDYVLRLFKKGRGQFPGKHQHELLEVEGKAEKLNGHILHLSYRSVDQYLGKLQEKYLNNEVENFVKSGKKIYWYDALRFPTQDFLKNFFVRNGYKDGLHGLVLAILQSFYMFLMFVKIWEMEDFWPYDDLDFESKTRKEFQEWMKDLRYWFWTVKIDQSKNSVERFFNRIKRKLVI